MMNEEITIEELQEEISKLQNDLNLAFCEYLLVAITLLIIIGAMIVVFYKLYSNNKKLENRLNEYEKREK